MKIFQDKNFVKKLNADLQNGGIVCFVTDTVWGIGCLPNSEKGADKIYSLKGRDRSKPLILMSNEVNNLLPFTQNISNAAKQLISDNFPGALTVITQKSDKVKPFICSGKNSIGIRVPNNTFFAELCKHIDGGVLATTSANISGQPSAKTYNQAFDYVGDEVDYIFEDYGYTCEGLESTVVLAVDENIKILRQGIIKI